MSPLARIFDWSRQANLDEWDIALALAVLAIVVVLLSWQWEVLP